MMKRSEDAINDRAKILFIREGEDMLCEMCKGRGIIYCITCKKGNISPPWLARSAEEKCSVCEGKKEMKCPVCDGKGEV